MGEESKYPKNEQAEKDVESAGGEGEHNAEATPEIADDAAEGQTTVPAPPDDASKAGGEPSEEVKDPHP